MKNDTKTLDAYYRRVMAFVREQELLAPGQRLVVALSGGKDSACLLRFLADLAQEYGWELHGAHVQHMLRPEAEQDLEFCRALCQVLGVSFHCTRVDVAAYAQNRRLGVEEAGRKIRYEYFSHLLTKLKADAVVTAHTASDQCETVLMRLVRGAALKGLGGIPPRRGAVVRPFLCLSSQEILAMLSLQGQAHVEDASNAGFHYLRNRLRHRILPLLEQENPALVQTVARNARILQEQEQLLHALSLRELARIATPDGCHVDKRAFRALCREPGMAALAAYLPRLAQKSLAVGEVSGALLERLCRLALVGKAGARLELGGGLCFCVGQTQLSFLCKEKPADYCVSLHPGVNPLPGGMARLVVEQEKNLANYKNVNKFLMNMKINSATIEGGLVARCRRPGERVCVNGMQKSVKKLICDRKFPAHLRPHVPVIADGQGIVWIPGVTLSDRARPTGPRVIPLRLEFGPFPEETGVDNNG